MAHVDIAQRRRQARRKALVLRIGGVVAAVFFIALVVFAGMALQNFPSQEDPPITVREAVITTFVPGMEAEDIELLQDAEQIDPFPEELARRIEELYDAEVAFMDHQIGRLVSILEDADLEMAIENCVIGRMINNGQSCIAAKRFLIAEPIADEFERRFSSAIPVPVSRTCIEIQSAVSAQVTVTVPGGLVAATALALILEFESADEAAVAILKHNTPCGVGQGATPLAAYQRAFETDPDSPFGGIIVCNRIKPHNVFKADYESGIVKMLVIGLGSSGKAAARLAHDHGEAGVSGRVEEGRRRALLLIPPPSRDRRHGPRHRRWSQAAPKWQWPLFWRHRQCPQRPVSSGRCGWGSCRPG